MNSPTHNRIDAPDRSVCQHTGRVVTDLRTPPRDAACGDEGEAL